MKSLHGMILVALKFLLLVLGILILSSYLDQQAKKNKEDFKFPDRDGFPTFIDRH